MVSLVTQDCELSGVVLDDVRLSFLVWCCWGHETELSGLVCVTTWD